MSTLAELKKLEERYPFTEEELEILLRGHAAMLDDSNEASFIAKLALSSPYSHFFLPEDEMQKRIDLVEDHVLPMGFSNEFRAATAADAFVNYANQGQELSFERFLEGIADTGRRGRKEALRVLYEIIPDPTPKEILDLCFRLSIAADVLVKPLIDKNAIESMLSSSEKACEPLLKSLQEDLNGEELTKTKFVRWADHQANMLSATLSTFTHNLIFHEKPYPASQVPFCRPVMDHVSDIFNEEAATLLFPLAVASSHFNGKMHRLYSSEQDGRSFNRLEWSVLGYSGPSLLVIRTDEDATLGGFMAKPWKDSAHFQGDSGSFIMQLEPTLKQFYPTGQENHFVYCHSESFDGGLPDSTKVHGLGFGGTTDKPRLFIPESLEECSADFLDHTYQQGDLLPSESLEKFQIKYLEVWGVGGDDKIAKGLRDRAEYRERTDTTILKARTLSDKGQILADLQSGLIPNEIFKHQEEVRGSQKFAVDDEHGGYKVERE